jgi:hypothetical protein
MSYRPRMADFLPEDRNQFDRDYARVCAIRGSELSADLRLDVELACERDASAVPIFTDAGSVGLIAVACPGPVRVAVESAVLKQLHGRHVFPGSSPRLLADNVGAAPDRIVSYRAEPGVGEHLQTVRGDGTPQTVNGLLD